MASETDDRANSFVKDQMMMLQVSSVTIPLYAMAAFGFGCLWAGDLSSPRPFAGSPGAVLRATQIASGYAHSLLIAEDGTIWAWGDNSYGRLGDGTTSGRAAPVRVSGLSGVVSIAAGLSHSLAVRNDGKVWAWGSNDSGKLGDGSVFDKTLPKEVSTLTGVVSVAAGGGHSLALKRDGTVWAWGNNSAGQLGDGSTSNRNLPVQVIGLNGAVAVAAGSGHSLALKGDGTLWAWGSNTNGQLGVGSTTNLNLPAQVIGLSGVVALAAASDHNLALKRDGTVWAWGSNPHGQLGDGSRTNRDFPVQVTGLTGAVLVSAASDHSLALKGDGTVWAWGSNTAGQLGDDSVADRYLPQQVRGLSGIIAVAAGGSSSFFGSRSLALKIDGSVWAWGANTDGQLGDGTTHIHRSAVRVSGLTGIVTVAAGKSHALALKKDGTVWAWGLNRSGQLGDGTTVSRPVPVQVKGLEGVFAVAAGEFHSLAVRSDGTIWAWGSNNAGQLGDGTDRDRNSPVQVGALSDAVAIAAGSGHSLAVSSDGSVWAWGNNYAGQLGDGTTTYRYSPVQVNELTGAESVAGGWLHSLAVKKDGSVWAWGWNGRGELGDGTNTSHTTPVRVSGLDGVGSVGAGRSLALKKDGTVWAWGPNNAGQLGDGTFVDRYFPVLVSGLTAAVAVAGGSDHSLALKADGTTWAWGYDVAGVLGYGQSSRGSAVPAQVGGQRGVVSLATGGDFGLWARSDGTVWAWGSNSYGQLGDGTSDVKVNPVAIVPPGSPNLSIAVTHSGEFVVGQPASYSIVVANFGQSATTGATIVVDTLPPGLAFVVASGSDWSCQVDDQTVTCTNPGPIQPAATSTITLNVDVLPAAHPGVTNIATVSNQSDLDFSNNTSGDPLYVAGASCAYAVTPASASFSPSGGSAGFAIQTDASCSWTVSYLPLWMTISGSSTGTGPANVTLVASVNTGSARTATVSIAGITVTLTQGLGGCTFLLSAGGQAFEAAGGMGSVDVTTASGCSWTVSNSQSWINFSGATASTGNGRVAYQVASNSAGSRRAVLNIAGQSYGVEQAAASIPGLAAIGSLAQVASAGFWTTTFTIVNMGATTAQVRVSTYDDNGTPLQLPLSFPQNLQNGPILASTLDRTLAPGASLLISTTGPDASPVQTGWAQVSSDGTIAAYAVLRLTAGGSEQEAVVPLETRNANSLVLAFDNTGGYATGVALANLLAQAGAISLTIKDDAGLQLQTTSLSLPIQGHAAFDLGSRFPSTAQKRGTVEFRSGRPGQLSVLGLRFNPKGAFTTIPPAVK